MPLPAKQVSAIWMTSESQERAVRAAIIARGMKLPNLGGPDAKSPKVVTEMVTTDRVLERGTTSFQTTQNYLKPQADPGQSGALPERPKLLICREGRSCTTLSGWHIRSQKVVHAPEPDEPPRFRCAP
jgi:hypothetical protein